MSKPITIPRGAKPGWETVLITRGDPRFSFSGVIRLVLGEDMQLRDKHGTIYAAVHEDLMTDNDDRAGASGVYLPEDNFLSESAKPHEFMTSSVTFQKYHSNEEARAWYLANAEQLAPKTWKAKAWLWLARVALLRFDSAYWDNERTLYRKEKL